MVQPIPQQSWVIDGTMIVEEYLGTSDGAARSPPLPRNTKCPSGRCSSWGMLQPTDAFHSTGLGRFEPITALGTRKLTRRMMQDSPKSGRGRRILSMRWLPSRSIHKMLPFPFSVRFYLHIYSAVTFRRRIKMRRRSAGAVARKFESGREGRTYYRSYRA